MDGRRAEVTACVSDERGDASTAAIGGPPDDDVDLSADSPGSHMPISSGLRRRRPRLRHEFDEADEQANDDDGEADVVVVTGSAARRPGGVGGPLGSTR